MYSQNLYEIYTLSQLKENIKRAGAARGRYKK